jgi:hypothetical protein
MGEGVDHQAVLRQICHCEPRNQFHFEGGKCLNMEARLPARFFAFLSGCPLRSPLSFAAPNQPLILRVEDIDAYGPNSRDICGGGRCAHAPEATPPAPAESVIERLKAGLILSRFECRNAGISIVRYLCPSSCCELRIDVLLNSIRL